MDGCKHDLFHSQKPLFDLSVRALCGYHVFEGDRLLLRTRHRTDAKAGPKNKPVDAFEALLEMWLNASRVFGLAQDLRIRKTLLAAAFIYCERRVS